MQSGSVGCSVIVPIYNNARSLPVLHDRLCAVLGAWGASFEIIYVNDASTDTSEAVLRRMSAADTHIRLLGASENCGQNAAILAGFARATGEVLITIDADLQNHPEDIPALLAALHDGADLVCGKRAARCDTARRKRVSKAANGFANRALGTDIDDWGCGLNALTASLADAVIAERPPPRLVKLAAVLSANHIVQCPVRHSARAYGQSQYTMRRLWRMVVCFLEEFPLRRSLYRLLHTGSDAYGGSRAADRRVWQRQSGALLCWVLVACGGAIARLSRLLARAAGRRESARMLDITASQTSR